MSEQRLAALTEEDHLGPAEHYDAYERQLHAKLIFLGESKVHGIGVFARVSLPPETCVGAAHGPRVDSFSGDVFLFKTPIKQEPIRFTGPLRFLNSSTDPNVVVRYHLGRTRFFTIRQVNVGQELLMDYRRDIEYPPDLKRP